MLHVPERMHSLGTSVAPDIAADDLVAVVTACVTGGFNQHEEVVPKPNVSAELLRHKGAAFLIPLDQ